MRRASSPLSAPGSSRLRLLVAARFTSVFGTGMAPIALAFAVLALPGAGPDTLGLVLFASAVPEVVFMLLGGVVADRFSRSAVMQVAEVAAGLSQLITAVLFLTDRATVPALVLLAAVNGLSIAMFSPALTGIVPDVVSDQHLQSANAYLRLATNLARILGTAVGGVIIATAGPGVALLVDAGTFLLAGLLLAFVRSPVPRAGTGTPGVWSELRTGWREFAARRWIVVIVVLFSLGNMGFSATVGVLGPYQAQEALGGAGPWSAVVTAFSIGTVAGVLVALRVRPQRPMVVAVLCAPVLGLPVALAAPPVALVWLIVTAFVAGIAIDVFSVLWDTALQQHVPPEALSRVSAYDWLGSTALVPIGLALSGVLVAVVGIGPALLITAGLCLLPGFAILDPQVRSLRAGRPKAE